MAIVKIKPLAKPAVEIRSAAKRSQINVMVLERPPKPLDKDVVLASAAAIHGNGHTGTLERCGEQLAGKLGTLVGVENVRLAITAQCLGKGINAKVGIQCIGNAP